MSAPINDGGPAFPVLERGADGLELTSVGMSLRAWLAGKALQGLAANPNVIGHNSQHGWAPVNCTEDQLAQYAVMLADSAIKELKA